MVSFVNIYSRRGKIEKKAFDGYLKSFCDEKFISIKKIENCNKNNFKFFIRDSLLTLGIRTLWQLTSMSILISIFLYFVQNLAFM